MIKNLDNIFIKKYNVKLFDKDKINNTYDIINIFLKNNKDNEQPFYIIDLSKIIDAYKNWIELLPYIKPFYAVKCNSNNIILETLDLLGCNFDCASESELKKIIEITQDPERIIFANPCKMASHLKYANINNVNLITFDCIEELYKIKLYHPSAKLILRLAVDDSNSICKFNIKFGCKLYEIELLLKTVIMLELNMIGFSFHVGSGCMSVDNFYEAINDCKKANEIAKKFDINISIIDLGGGFPGIDKNIKFKDIAESINNGIRDFFEEELKNNTIKFIAEPGRYFVQKSHTLVLNVIGKKNIIDENNERIIIYYLNDGVYNSFNCIFFDYVTPIIVPFNKKDGVLYKSKIFGPTCDSIDLILDNIMLEELYIGDWMYVEDFGAYTVSASSGFNGFTTSINKYISYEV